MSKDAVVALIGLLLLLIVGLLWERAKKQKAESALRESEKRFRLMADASPAFIWLSDAQPKMIYLNDRYTSYTGPDVTVAYGDNWMTYIHPEDLGRALENLARAMSGHQTFSHEIRIRRTDGSYRWVLDFASPRFNGDGSFAGFIGSSIDITEQKVARDALEKISGRLIEAQEQERSRIARELHDDICQRLALLSMEIERAKRAPNGSIESMKSNLEAISKNSSKIASDVQSLSHQLHSSLLDYLGVAAAAKGFCEEFSKQHEVCIEFGAEGIPENLPKEISLCLFRIAQEALHNAVKYSGVRQFAVKLSGTDDEIQLVVSDTGVGFDIKDARKTGLGLISMRERVNLVHGSFSAESKLGEGTRIVVTIPLVAENEPTLNDGTPPSGELYSNSMRQTGSFAD